MGRETKQTSFQNSNTERNPWAPAQPVLRSVLDDVQTYGTGDAFRPTYSTDTTQGLDRLSNLATTPNNIQTTLPTHIAGAGQAYDTGGGVLTGSARGDYLEGNPYLDSVLQSGATRIADRVNSSMAGAGRYGSGAHTGILTDRLGDYYNRALMDNYNRERGYQMDSAGRLFNYGQQQPELAGVLDRVDQSQANLQLATGQMRDQQEEADRLAELRAAEWRAGLASPIANLGGTANTTGTVETRQYQPANWGGVLASGAGMLMSPIPGTSMLGRGIGLLG